MGSTGYYSRRLPHTTFASNFCGEPDLSIFDFTNLYAARNSCRSIVRKGFPLLVGIVGDSLLEPFWPDGTGCARVFLSALDAAWMIRSWSLQTNPLQVLEERENHYSILSQTTDDGIKTNYSKFTIDPRTRYKSIPATSKDEKIIALYDTDNKEEMRYLEEKFKSKSYFDSLAYQNIMRRYKAIKSPFKRQVSFAGASRVVRVLGKKSSRARETVMQKLGKIPNPFSRQNSVFPNLFHRQTSVHPTMFEDIAETVDGNPTHSKYKTQQSCLSNLEHSS